MVNETEVLRGAIALRIDLIKRRLRELRQEKDDLTAFLLFPHKLEAEKEGLKEIFNDKRVNDDLKDVAAYEKKDQSHLPLTNPEE